MAFRMAKKALLFLLAGVVAVFATEGFTRVLIPQSKETVLDILVPDETVGYIYQSDVSTRECGREFDVPFETNRQGLRDRNYGKSNANDFRVLLIGNSYSVSHGVEIEKSLSRALENELTKVFSDAGIKRNVQVINTSNAGYNAYHYWKSYQRWAPVYHPDVVIVGFSSSREHLSNSDDTRFLVQDGLVRASYKEGEKPVLRRRSMVYRLRKHLARSSDLYVLMRNFFYYNEKIQQFVAANKTGEGIANLVDPYNTTPSEQTLSGVARSLDYIGRLQAETTRDNVPMLVLSIPRNTEILESNWSTACKHAEILGVKIDRQEPIRRLSDHCKSINQDMLDLAAPMLSVGASGFFVHDGHWNDIGIASAARYVAGHWQLLGLPPFAN